MNGFLGGRMVAKISDIYKIEDGEIKPVSSYHQAFESIQSETKQPVLRDYGAYVVECSKMKVQPLTREEWSAKVREL